MVEESNIQGKNPAKWLAQVKKRLLPDYRIRSVTPSVSIFRVPRPMFSPKPQCYLPQLVSLGPYHCQMNPQISLMEEYKIEAVRRTLKRVGNKTADNLKDEVLQLEDEIRKSYEETIDYDGETLAWMLTMDACFILEFLRSHSEDTPKDVEPFSLVFRFQKDENIVTQEIARDILKLENQIPLFVLRSILELEPRDSDDRLKDSVSVLMDLGGLFDIGDRTMYAEHIPNARHLLDLLHKETEHFLLKCLGPAVAVDINSQKGSDDPINNPSAEALQKVGVRIRLSKDKIYFEKSRFGRSSTLFLPEIKISDSTEPMLLNLMAFEACKMQNRKAVVTRFVYFLVFLITSQKDIAILTQEKVISNYMGNDKKTAALFKDLCDQTVEPRLEEFEAVLQQVAEHCNSRINLWISQFKDEYCSKPWYLISLAGAVVLLGLTFVQTLYSVRK